MAIPLEWGDTPAGGARVPWDSWAPRPQAAGCLLEMASYQLTCPRFLWLHEFGWVKHAEPWKFTHRISQKTNKYVIQGFSYLNTLMTPTPEVEPFKHFDNLSKHFVCFKIPVSGFSYVQLPLLRWILGIPVTPVIFGGTIQRVLPGSTWSPLMIIDCSWFFWRHDSRSNLFLPIFTNRMVRYIVRWLTPIHHGRLFQIFILPTHVILIPSQFLETSSTRSINCEHQWNGLIKYKIIVEPSVSSSSTIIIPSSRYHRDNQELLFRVSKEGAFAMGAISSLLARWSWQSPEDDAEDEELDSASKRYKRHLGCHSRSTKTVSNECHFFGHWGI